MVVSNHMTMKSQHVSLHKISYDFIEVLQQRSPKLLSTSSYINAFIHRANIKQKHSSFQHGLHLDQLEVFQGRIQPVRPRCSTSTVGKRNRHIFALVGLTLSRQDNRVKCKTHILLRQVDVPLSFFPWAREQGCGVEHGGQSQHFPPPMQHPPSQPKASSPACGSSSTHKKAYKSVLRDLEEATRVSHETVPQECPERVSHKGALKERPTRECRTRVPYKSVPQECPTSVP